MSEKIWFITGIGRGLGRALAEAVLQRGDTVIGTTRNGDLDLPAHRRLIVLPLDVTDRGAAFRTVAAAHAARGRLDVVVNNAGFGLLGSIEASSPTETHEVMAANFLGPLNVTQAVLPLLRRQRSGHIVNITSIAGLAPGAGSGLYAAAKFAVEGFSASLALEVAPLGLRVTTVAPGALRTDFLADTSIRHTAAQIDDYAGTSGQMVAYLQKIAGKQLGDPARAALAICRCVDSETPPLHLVLGSDALKRTRSMIEQFNRELDAWQSVTLSTDFPAD